uniref:Uncharacterized protein n=1 Tax=Ditylum brightwellii TaxID=49249 RepID=A0A7S4W1A8_9STRA
MIESSAMTQRKCEEKEIAESEWDDWCKTFIDDEVTREKAMIRTKGSKQQTMKNVTGGSIGVNHLIKYGTISNGQFSSTSTMSGLGSSSANAEYASARFTSPVHYFDQLLNILFSLVRSEPFQSSMADHSNKWIYVLFSAIGLSCIYDNQENILTRISLIPEENRLPHYLPMRHRVRMFRLLRYLLVATKPESPIIDGLFLMAGCGTISNSTFALFRSKADGEVGIDEGSNQTSSISPILLRDTNTLAKEAVSLLRRLYYPSDGFNIWRQSFHNMMKDTFNENSLCCSSKEQEERLIKQKGILAFFGGMPGHIESGSYALLKPAAAASLSSPPPSSSKSHSGSSGSSSGGSTPHHVVGSGTEGIVTGLCRSDAMAGIVSSIDVKSGMCEIVILDRSIESSLLLSSCGNSNMTVRAVRASLADVVSAEEVPAFLGEDFPVESAILLPLKEGTNILLSEIKYVNGVSDSKENENGETKDGESEEVQLLDQCDHNACTEKLDTLDLAPSLMALRSSIVALSDKRLLSRFVKMETNLSQVLELATSLISVGSSSSTTTSSNESLSVLPIHEARFWHLQSMLLELRIRSFAFESLPLSHWEGITKAEEEKENEAEDSDRDAKTPGKTSQKESYSTPPATVGAISGSAEISTSVASADEEGNESVSTADTHGQGQSSANTTTATATDEDDEAAETAAAHLREAAIAQMAELGLPRSWSELALRRTGGTNIEAAVHFCLERGGDMERLLAEERERERRMSSSSGGSGRRRGLGGGTSSTTANHLIRQLIEMGFPSHWCAEALAATRNNVDEALTWILTNGERLSAQDEGDEDDEADDNEDGDEDDDDSLEDDEEEESGNNSDKELQADEERTGDKKDSDTADGSETVSCGNEGKASAEKDAADSVVSKSEDQSDTDVSCKGWSGTVCPLRFVSGRSNIDSTTLEVTGLPTGGFSSVGTKGVLLSTGKWYYEAEIHTAGCLQIGWADGSFAGHCQSDRGDGCGDGPSSWAFDGWRRYRWHTTATEWGCRWKEGDIVGCMVDMDNKIMSFTLNGCGEEIGMGVAFSGVGFRPCGGVYACVSFNRKERIRLILGGKCSQPFKYNPPEGYRGVGEAVLESVAERELLLKEEELLRSTSCDSTTNSPKSNSSPTSNKKYLCDFSDGEHGHELFAWQHRYYGSDASVHLGAGRSATRGSSGSHRSSSGGSGVKYSSKDTVAVCLKAYLKKIWMTEKIPLTDSGDESSSKNAIDPPVILSHVKRVHDKVLSQIQSELRDICHVLGMLYARKFILHMVVTQSNEFDMNHILNMNGLISSAEKSQASLTASQRLWSVLENCASLHAAGWVGEAGAMAIAAEALGLGISSHDHGSSAGGAAGVGPASHGDDSVLLPAGGITQVLSTVLTTVNEKGTSPTGLTMHDTSTNLAACAEAALGGEGGGSLVFLRSGLQSAAAKSVEFRRVLVAAVRSMVRLLAVVEFGNVDTSPDGGATEDDDIEGTSGSSNYDGQDEDNGRAESADARLVSFLTGLLMSYPMQCALSVEEWESIMTNLLEAWSIGLLSASAPWRMVCALTVSGILNICPTSLVPALERIPTLARFYARLESTVARRVWAERAAVPVCSRYVQALIELLGSVKRSLRQYSLAGVATPISYTDVSVDAASPLPMRLDHNVDIFDESGHISNRCIQSCKSWEWDEGWISGDAGWEVWTGFVECMTVDWKVPSRSPVRTLMDGGEGPPLLREGCIVMRGLDWEENGSGSITGNEDGKDLYEKEKAAREKEKQALEEKESQQAVTEDPDTKGNEKECDDSGEGNPSLPTDENGNSTDGPEQPSPPVPREEDKNESREGDSQKKLSGSKKKRKKTSKSQTPHRHCFVS